MKVSIRRPLKSDSFYIAVKVAAADAGPALADIMAAI
jgi:hypothetical protein